MALSPLAICLPSSDICADSESKPRSRRPCMRQMDGRPDASIHAGQRHSCAQPVAELGSTNRSGVGRGGAPHLVPAV